MPKENAWLKLVKSYKAKHKDMKFSDVLKACSKLYKKSNVKKSKAK